MSFSSWAAFRASPRVVGLDHDDEVVLEVGEDLGERDVGLPDVVARLEEALVVAVDRQGGGGREDGEGAQKHGHRDGEPGARTRGVDQRHRDGAESFSDSPHHALSLTPVESIGRVFGRPAGPGDSSGATGADRNRMLGAEISREDGNFRAQ